MLLDRVSIDPGAVGALEVVEQVGAASRYDPAVFGGDGGVLQRDVRRRAAPRVVALFGRTGKIKPFTLTLFDGESALFGLDADGRCRRDLSPDGSEVVRGGRICRSASGTGMVASKVEAGTGRRGLGTPTRGTRLLPGRGPRSGPTSRDSLRLLGEGGWR